MSVSSAGIKRGTLGPTDTVEVNYLKLNIDKLPNHVYHYDVTITPDRPKKFLRLAFDQFQRCYCPNNLLAYDGVKSCYAVEKLPDKTVSQTVSVKDNDREKEFKVDLKETEKLIVDMNSLRT